MAPVSSPTSAACFRSTKCAPEKTANIVSLDTLEKAAVKPPEPALYDWTNRRVDESDVQWFADGKRLLVAVSGDLFIVDLA